MFSTDTIYGPPSTGLLFSIRRDGLFTSGDEYSEVWVCLLFAVLSYRDIHSCNAFNY